MDAAQKKDLSKKIGMSAPAITKRIHALHEENPMLGHRGCRLGISYPAVTATQVGLSLEAAAEVQSKGTKVLPEIMVPLVSYDRELELQKQVIDETAESVRKKLGLKKSELKYTVGTMIEIPRAAITADKVAEHAEFFSSALMISLRQDLDCLVMIPLASYQPIKMQRFSVTTHSLALIRKV